MKLKHLLLILLAIATIGMVMVVHHNINRQVSIIEQERIENE